tara:strand:+ start:191 stop:1297 length:1107 start_codon:yes stop_codon:yes gene_type:complete
MLSIADYGVLVALYSLIYIFTIFSESVQTVITRFASTERDEGRLKNLFKKALRKSYSISFSLFVAYLLISIPLGFMLKISYPLMAINGLMLFALFLLPISRGVLQGKKMFKALGFNMVAESLTKLILAIALVLLGWRVFGALTATLLGYVIAFAFSLYVLKPILKQEEKPAKTKDIYHYTKPVFIITFVLLIFFSLDAIIAKIVFSPEVAGYYAIASILGKIIFFGTQPISKAMFPLSAEDKSKKKKVSFNVFMNSLVFLSIAIIAALSVFYFFPELIIRVFAGRYIPQSSSILFLVAIAMSLLSLTNLILLYKIAAGNLKGYQYLFIFLAIQVFLLFYFSESLFQFSIALVTASAAFFWGSVFLMNE